MFFIFPISILHLLPPPLHVKLSEYRPECRPQSREIKFHVFQFNFVGKLLGPKGNSMKRLQEETMTKMAVLGRGSMRDKQKVR